MLQQLATAAGLLAHSASDIAVGLPEAFAGAFCGFAQRRLEFGEGPLGLSLGEDMPARYLGDLLERVVAAVGAGASAPAAGRFGVRVSTAIRWGQRLRAEGRAQPGAMGGDHRSRLVEHLPAVLELLAKHPDLTLAKPCPRNPRLG